MGPSSSRHVRLDVPGLEVLQRLIEAPLPLGLRSLPAERRMHRDLFLDTADGALASRDVSCRFRLGADDRRRLTVEIGEWPDSRRSGVHARYDATVVDVDIWSALEGISEPARRLRGLIDPARLEIVAQLEVDRHVRRSVEGWAWLRRSRFEFLYDNCVVRGAGQSRAFQELSIRRLRSGGLQRAHLAGAFHAAFGLRPVTSDRRQRAQLLMKWLEHQDEAIALGAKRMVVLIGQQAERVAFQVNGGSPLLPSIEGSGESACRALMREVFGRSSGDVRLVGTAPARDRRPMLEVWLLPDPTLGELHGSGERDSSALEWWPLNRALSTLGGFGFSDPLTADALTIFQRSAMLRQRTANGASTRQREIASIVLATPRAAPELFLGAELSELEFHARVVAMAEDRELPLLERVRFLAISGSNLDEFFMVRVAALKASGAEPSAEGIEDDDGLSPAERLEAIARRVPELVDRQQSCWRECRAGLAGHGVRLLTWAELDEPSRVELREFFQDEIYPALTPLAITVSAGHPFPHLPNLSLSIAATLSEPDGAGTHLVQIEIPTSLPRLVRSGSGDDFVPIEEIVRGNLDALYPDARVREAYLFRVTRRGGVGAVRRKGARLLQAMEEAAARGGVTAVVRIEVEQGMPSLLRELLLEELQREQVPSSAPLTEADVHEVNGLLDLGALQWMAELDRPALRFPPFRGATPLPAARSIWDVLRQGDVLVHHPYEDFAATTLRFLSDAADDPDVIAIKLTLYRAGKRSPVVETLVRAANSGKEVAVFVELKARFDEEHNVRWAKALQRAGIHVVYGVRNLKTHAKMALVVRREEGKLRRYVHVGTGNYNVETARCYTDLGLLSADEALGADVHELFNELTGSSLGPRRLPRRCLVAPRHLLPGLLARVAREAEHARSGIGGRIRAKMNGLSDAEVVRALYDASNAGVEIDLLVRGICTLRPGVRGQSERIRVVSSLGRFLEHARIYHFANAGAPEYFLGSADWRRRNLRRRVELLAPISDPRCQARLDRLLSLELVDPVAWELTPDGTYHRRAGGNASLSTQEVLLREVEPDGGGAAWSAEG